MECVTSSQQFWTLAAIRFGFLLFLIIVTIIPYLLLRHEKKKNKLASSNGRASVLHTEDGSSILPVSTFDKETRREY